MFVKNKVPYWGIKTSDKTRMSVVRTLHWSMQKNIMKKIILFLSLSLMAGICAVSAQNESTTTQSVTTTTTSDKSEGNNTNNILLYTVGGVSLVALAIVIGMMYRDRKRSIGGIQSQTKEDPRPVTTQSINNPSSGV